MTERVAPIAKTSVAAPQADNPQARQERQILEILIQKPGFFQKLEVRRISAAGFVTPGYQRLLQGIARNADSMGEPDWVSILMQSEPEYVDDIRSLALAELPVRNQMELERYAKGIVKSALMQALLREKNDLLAAFKRIDADGQPEAANALQQELMKLELERRSLM